MGKTKQKTLDFGEARQVLDHGGRVRRKGWDDDVWVSMSGEDFVIRNADTLDDGPYNPSDEDRDAKDWVVVPA